MLRVGERHRRCGRWLKFRCKSLQKLAHYSAQINSKRKLRCGDPLFEYCPDCANSLFDNPVMAPDAVVLAASRIAEAYENCAEGVDGRTANNLGVLLHSMEALMVALVPEAALGRSGFTIPKRDISSYGTLSGFAASLLESRSLFDSIVGGWCAASVRRWPNLPMRGGYHDIARAISLIPDQEIRTRLTQWCEESQPSVGPNEYDTTADVQTDNRRVTLRWAAWTLGISEHLVRQLISAKLLRSSYAFESSRKSDVMVSLSDLDDLMGRLRTRSVDIPADRQIVLVDASRGFGISGMQVSFSDLVARATTGRSRIYLPLGAGLDTAAIDRADFERPLPATTESDQMGVDSAASFIGVYPDAVRRLVKAGILKCDGERKTAKSPMAFRREAIERFHATYVFVGEIANAWGMNRTNLTDRLIHVGVNPVSGPSIDGGLVYLFCRSDIQGVDISAAKSDAYKSRAGRRRNDAPKVSSLGVRSSTVCRRLGISAQALGRLEAAGVLNALPVSYTAGNRRYYDRDQVKAYAVRYVENPALVSLEIGAKRMSCSTAKFIQNYIDTGVVVMTVDELGRRYVRATALRSLEKEVEEYCSVAVAAKRFGVDRSVIANLRSDPRVRVLFHTRNALTRCRYHISDLRHVLHGINPTGQGHSAVPN